MTGGRLQRVLPYVESDEEFCFTYGDGLADVNLAMLRFHRSHKKLVTLTATQSVGKFGALEIGRRRPGHFVFRKAQGRWTLGQRRILRPLSRSRTAISRGTPPSGSVLPSKLSAREGQVSAYKHHGFWQPMDTLHDRKFLEDLWDTGSAPWKIW